MPLTILPFNNTNKADKHNGNSNSLAECGLYRMLPKPAQDVCKRYPHVLEYLHMVPIGDIGIPEFHLKLSRNLYDLARPNLIYPTKNGVYIHIYPDFDDGRNIYIPIEPAMNVKLGSLMEEVEMRLLDVVDSFDDTEDPAARGKLLREWADKICAGGPHSKGGFKLFRRKKGGVSATPRQLAAIKYLLVRDKVGLGVLETMVNDEHVEDISCSGVGTIFIEHKIFQSLKSTVNFTSHNELDDFALRLSERVNKPVTFRSPVVDAALPDGSRINIVYGQNISKRGSNFSIRKFSETPISILELVDFGTLDYRMAAYLAIVVSEGMNVFICGETASGKTTTLNAITTFINPNAKIVSIEDTPELQVPHKNWIRELTQTSKDTNDAGITTFDLLKAALRQRPNVIIIGEIRSVEGLVAFQAMQTGHAVLSTFHAASVEKLIQRLTGSPISVPKNYIDNLNVILIQSTVRLPSGRTGRRVISISEIIGYDYASHFFNFMDIFQWDPTNDSFNFVGDNNSYLLEHKIAPKLGIPSHQKRRIYSELNRRAKVLEKLHAQKGVSGFYELLKVLAKAQREGLF